MRVVYRAVTTPLPGSLVDALKAGEVDAVPAFFASQCRKLCGGGKERWGCRTALAVRHLCLSAQVAEPLTGARHIMIAARPDEAALIELLARGRGDRWYICIICVISCLRG
jgi:hypothetical protein